MRVVDSSGVSEMSDDVTCLIEDDGTVMCQACNVELAPNEKCPHFIRSEGEIIANISGAGNDHLNSPEDWPANPNKEETNSSDLQECIDDLRELAEQWEEECEDWIDVDRLHAQDKIQELREVIEQYE